MDLGQHILNFSSIFLLLLGGFVILDYYSSRRILKASSRWFGWIFVMLAGIIEGFKLVYYGYLFTPTLTYYLKLLFVTPI